ncbi:glycerophosphodiester phosphodiesterase family protein [Ligilactobacillus sp. WC1T17]
MAQLTKMVDLKILAVLFLGADIITMTSQGALFALLAVVITFDGIILQLNHQLNAKGWLRLFFLSPLRIIFLGPLFLHAMFQLSLSSQKQNVLFLYRHQIALGIFSSWLLWSLAAAIFLKRQKKLRPFLRALFISLIGGFLLILAESSVLMLVASKILAALFLALVWLYLLGANGWLIFSLVSPPKNAAVVKSIPKPWLLLCLSLALGVRTGFFYQQLQDGQPHKMLVIAHRGVNSAHDFPNHTTSLTTTAAKLHPSYSELDIRQTKDQHFVVSHDDFFKLKGQDVSLEKAALSQVIHPRRKLSLETYRIYLAKALQIKQPLLTEFKTNGNSQAMVDSFFKQFGSQVQKNRGMVHSIDYTAVRQTKKSAPHLKVGWVMPFTVFYPPKCRADFYSANITLLNRTFIKKAHQEHKEVYAWTVNSRFQTVYAYLLGCDGLITDHGSQVKKWLKLTPKEQLLGKFYLNLWLLH